MEINPLDHFVKKICLEWDFLKVSAYMNSMHLGSKLCDNELKIENSNNKAQQNNLR
jgi:hypothetical protein